MSSNNNGISFPTNLACFHFACLFLFIYLFQTETVEPRLDSALFISLHVCVSVIY